MKPTDEELEAMAVRLECDHWFDAAAMLRACKGRVRVKPLEWGEGADDGIFADRVWSADAYLIERRNNVDNAFDLHCDFWDGHNARRYPTLEAAKAAAQADYEARILAALDPDHAQWDAAIEAAAKVAQSYGCCHVPQEIAEEIRALKKGQTNE